MRKTLICFWVVTLCSVASTALGAVRIIVLPLESLSKATSLRWLSEGVAIAVSEQLKVPGVDAVDRSRRAPLVEALDLPPNSPLSRASMIRVAQESGADYLAMGSYSGTADNLQVILRMLNMKSMKFGPRMVVNGPAAALPQMENELAWNLLSTLELAQGISREQFKARARAVPNNAYSLYVRSLGMADESEQVDLLAKAVEAHEDFPEAQFLLGRYIYQQGDCGKALDHLEIALKEERNRHRAEFMLGTCCLKQGKFTEAIRAYSHILSFVQSYEALNNMAMASLQKGDYAVATENLLEARKMMPDNVTIELNLAIVRHLQGNQDAAKEVLQRVIATHPNIGMLNYLLSVVLAVLGEGDASAAALAQAKRLGIEPDKLQSQDPKTWARIFPIWEPHS